MSNLNSFYSAWTPRLLSVLHIIAAFMFIAHGAQKLFGFAWSVARLLRSDMTESHPVHIEDSIRKVA
jgi:uncharacterized membrane protein YphA (DoxX/SURF4 family)